MYIFKHIFHIYIYRHIYITYTYVYTHITNICIHMHIYITYIHTQMYVYILFIYIYLYLCVYILYIYTYIYKCIYNSFMSIKWKNEWNFFFSSSVPRSLYSNLQQHGEPEDLSLDVHLRALHVLLSAGLHSNRCSQLWTMESCDLTWYKLNRFFSDVPMFQVSMASWHLDEMWPRIF